MNTSARNNIIQDDTSARNNPIRMAKKIRPCDCKDIETARKLNEQGIGHNDDSIIVEPNVVILTMGHTQVRIPMNRFKMFAEWYLEEQELEDKK